MSPAGCVSIIVEASTCAQSLLFLSWPLEKVRDSPDITYLFPPDGSSAVIRQLVAPKVAMPICSKLNAAASNMFTPSRGYWFTSPVDIEVVAVSLVAISGREPVTQSIQVITSDFDFPSTNYTTELYTTGRLHNSRWHTFFRPNYEIISLVVFQANPLDRQSKSI